MHTRQVFVAVTDRSGAPVLDLTANDFEITEHGVARPIDRAGLAKAVDRWPVFVIVSGDGAESSAGANEKKFNDWARALPERGIAAHGVVLKAKSGGLPEIVTSHVVQNAGGHYDVMNTSNSLPAKLTAIAQ